MDAIFVFKSVVVVAFLNPIYSILIRFFSQELRQVTNSEWKINVTYDCSFAIFTAMFQDMKKREHTDITANFFKGLCTHSIQFNS